MADRVCAERISGDEGSTTNGACLGMQIALHACTDEVQASWSADDDVCGSPSNGDKGGDMDCVSGETCVDIGSGAKTGARSYLLCTSRGRCKNVIEIPRELTM